VIGEGSLRSHTRGDGVPPVRVEEAKLVETEGGLEPASEGWFVVNTRDACWWRHDVFGAGCVFEGEEAAPFKELGINLTVLYPGRPNCMYHGESTQEDFLVLHGECLLIVEGQERPLRAWDFVHCPAWTEHVFVGAGEGPCVVLMVGARREGSGLRYPVAPVAAKYGASVEDETTSGREAYARFPPAERARLDEPELPWADAG
jgi:uncharacterized cupin superfamily protein